MVAAEQYGYDPLKEVSDLSLQEQVEYNDLIKSKKFTGKDMEIFLAVLGISPPVNAKFRKMYSAMKSHKNQEATIEARGWDMTADGRFNPGPNYKIWGSAIEGLTNIPVGRIATKMNNVAEALDNRNKFGQRLSLALGWGTFETGVKNEENEAIEKAAKSLRKVEGIQKTGKTRLEKKIEKQKIIDSIGKIGYIKLKRNHVKSEEEIEKERIKYAAKGMDYDSMQNMSKADRIKYRRKVKREFSPYYTDPNGNVYTIGEIQDVAESSGKSAEQIIKLNKLEKKIKGKR